MGWIGSADTNLQSIVDLLNSVDALAIAADNSSQSAADRQATAIEINAKLEDLMGLVNATHGDRYLFAGYSTTTSPFVATRDAVGHIQSAAANSETIAGQIYRAIGQDESVQINVSGSQLFQPVGQEGTDTDLFYVIARLRDTIANNNTPPVGSEATQSNEHLRAQLQQIRERIIDQQTSLGSVGQRLGTVEIPPQGTRDPDHRQPRTGPGRGSDRSGQPPGHRGGRLQCARHPRFAAPETDSD